jgi:hypothetical protein
MTFFNTLLGALMVNPLKMIGDGTSGSTFPSRRAMDAELAPRQYFYP